MSIPESEFPLYLRIPNWQKKAAGVVARTVETTATVLVDLDIHGRVIGVEVLGEVPTRVEWAVGKHKLHDGSWDFIQEFDDEEGARSLVRKSQWYTERSGSQTDRALLRRVVTDPVWVEVDEKETGDG